MARPPRIEFPNAWYHIMNRGAGRRIIFPNDDLKRAFLELLSEIHVEYEIEIHAYCLMSNHYHLLVRTRHANLNLAMQKLGSNYSRLHNRALKIDGPLFKGRYKAILVAEAAYLAQVSRYIHRNPVEAKLVKSLREYEWSSYPAYCEQNRRQPWLYVDASICRISPQGKLTEYLSFVENPESASMNEFYRSKRIPGILGNKALRRLIENRTGYTRHWKPPKRPDVGKIIESVVRVFGVEREMILAPQQGKLNQARGAAIYLAHHVCKHSSSDLKEQFGVEKSGITQASSQMKRTIAGNQELAWMVQNAEEMVLGA